MNNLTVNDYIKQIMPYSNMPLDISILMEPFGLYLSSQDLDGVLTGIFIEDLLDQYAESEKLDVYTVLEIVAFYANEHEVNTIIHSLMLAPKHGVANSL